MSSRESKYGKQSKALLKFVGVIGGLCFTLARRVKGGYGFRLSGKEKVAPYTKKGEKMKFDLMNKEMLFMVFRVNLLFLKDMFSIPKNYLDYEIFHMLDEYSYYYEFSKEWRKRC